MGVDEEEEDAKKARSLRKMANMSVINYTTKSCPYLQKQRKHERVRYECDKCEYKATCKSDITKLNRQSMKELNMNAV